MPIDAHRSRYLRPPRRLRPPVRLRRGRPAIRSPFFSYLETSGGDELGKRSKFFKKLKGAAKVARGSIGFKKGLTPAQLKKAGLARKLLGAAAVITAGVVLMVVSKGKAGTFLMSKGPKLLSGAQKVAEARQKISDARKKAGLPPIHYDRTPEQEVAAAATTVPGAATMTPDEVTAKATEIATRRASQGEQLPYQVETPSLQTDPEQFQEAKSEAVATVGKDEAARIQAGGFSPAAIIPIATGVGAIALIVFLAQSKKMRTA